MPTKTSTSWRAAFPPEQAVAGCPAMGTKARKISEYGDDEGGPGAKVPHPGMAGGTLGRWAPCRT